MRGDYIMDLFTAIVISLNILVTQPINNVSDNDVLWLTQNIYHEARGESVKGQYLVGIVTLERLKEGRWGNTVMDVVTAKAQFSWWGDKKISLEPEEPVAWEKAKFIAYTSIVSHSFANSYYDGLTHYHNKTVYPNWAEDGSKYADIGQHIFYKGVK